MNSSFKVTYAISVSVGFIFLKEIEPCQSVILSRHTEVP